MKPDAIVDWMRRTVLSHDGKTPLETLASGGYEQISGIAEDLIAPTFT